MNLFAKTFLTLGVFAIGGSSFASDTWYTNYDEAVKVSKKSGKPILVNFTGSDWCGWCIRLQNEVFDKPDFKKWASKKVVLLELDFPQHKVLKPDLKKQNTILGQKYASVVPGFPTILFMDPDGTVFGKYGYDDGGPSKWTKMADRLLPLRKKASKKLGG